ncbi:divergent PAP2 family protein [Candidatus Woesearchaeota archaeon]|nr:divergent PAP2 family protein [Candidatus Woesearchaeota archaeon]
MDLKFIIIPLIIWVISQSIKFLIYILRKGTISRKDFSWICQWASGSPSTHASMLIATLYLLAAYKNFDAIFGFAFVVSLMLVYNLLAERKKQELFEEHLRKAKEGPLKTIVKDGKMLDISGHTIFEIASGIIFGLVATFVLTKIF